MEPKLYTGERILVNLLQYHLKPPKRFDIIIFQSPINAKNDYIKRVIGLENEKIEIKNGLIFINDKFLKESYVACRQSGENFGPVKVTSKHIFVLGDNRLTSQDSRCFGSVDLKSIKGKAFLALWPPSSFGLIK